MRKDKNNEVKNVNDNTDYKALFNKLIDLQISNYIELSELSLKHSTKKLELLEEREKNLLANKPLFFKKMWLSELDEISKEKLELL